MEGPYLPEGSGDEESPEEPNWSYMDERALRQYEERLAQFDSWVLMPWGVRKRRKLSDYTAKNCEEAWGGRSSPGSAETHRLG